MMQSQTGCSHGDHGDRHPGYAVCVTHAGPGFLIRQPSETFHLFYQQH